MKSQGLKRTNMPNKPGVYFFLKNKEVLYIGKATSLRDRVRSYFGKDLIITRGPLILDMVTQATRVDFEEADTVLEALILEAHLIKKHQPKYNTKEKDNKSWNYVCITKEDIPKVLVIRGRSLQKNALSKEHSSFSNTYGPFTNGMQLRDAMKIIRRIFPYIDEQSSKKQNTKFYQQLGLAPEMQISSAARNYYLNNIANLKLFFQGKKKKIIKDLKKDMMKYAKEQKFEQAAEVKRQIFALEHINDVALIKEDLLTAEKHPGGNVLGSSDISRIEAYDIAHMSGGNMVGVMTVVEGDKVAKHEYKKFIIRTQSGANDTGALEEVLARRFRHTEWGLPQLVVVDGSTAQINVAKRVLDRYQFDIPIVSVVKDDKHKAKAIMGDEGIIKIHKSVILLANSEAHRFAIAFHKHKRNKNFLK